jgi:hypothetical protein
VTAEPTPAFIDRRVRMSTELWDALDALAEENGRNIADEIRVACLNHVRRHGHKLTDVPVLSGRGRRGQGRRR